MVSCSNEMFLARKENEKENVKERKRKGKRLLAETFLVVLKVNCNTSDIHKSNC